MHLNLQVITWVSFRGGLTAGADQITRSMMGQMENATQLPTPRGKARAVPPTAGAETAMLTANVLGVPTSGKLLQKMVSILSKDGKQSWQR